MERMRLREQADSIELIRTTPPCKQLNVGRRTLIHWRKAGNFPAPIWLADSAGLVCQRDRALD